jgi:endonuclease YncB( thermonuclease family)
MIPKFILFAIFLPVFCIAQITAKVIGIKDGGTVVILEKNNTQKTLRLAEVDCPESNSLLEKMQNNLQVLKSLESK